MSFEPVNVYVQDQLARPVAGVIVNIRSADGLVFYTQQTTDDDGIASFLLNTQDYSMRFYKEQATFPQPQLFTVLPAPEANNFQVTPTLFVPPIATSPRLCRCSGFFLDPSGAPLPNLDLHFYPQFTAIVIDGSAMTPETIAIHTDGRGYAQIDLVRGAQYRVTIQGLEDEERFIRVPDLPSANLPDVLFAIVARVVFDPPGPYALGVGQQITITPTIYDSAGATLTGTGDSDVLWSTADTTIANVAVLPTTLTLQGVKAGSTTLILSRRDLSIVKIPVADIEGQPVALTVS